MELILYKDISGQVMGPEWEALGGNCRGDPRTPKLGLLQASSVYTLSLWPGWSANTCCFTKSGHHRWFEMSQRPGHSPSSPWHEKLSCPSPSSWFLWWLKSRCSVCLSMKFVCPWSDSPSTSVGLETSVKRGPTITQWVNGFGLRTAPWPSVLMPFWRGMVKGSHDYLQDVFCGSDTLMVVNFS